MKQTTDTTQPSAPGGAAMPVAARPRPRFLPLACLALLAAVMGFPARGGAAQAVRSFSSAEYEVNRALDVTIQVQPGAEASAFVVSDKLPANWQFVESGAAVAGYDAVNRMVKFGPYNNNQTRSLAYRALPVGAAPAGTYDPFVGELSVDGGKATVSGASWVAQSVAPPPGIDEGLELWLKFDNDVSDSSGKGRNGVLIGSGTDFQSGARDMALKFNRASTNLVIPSGPAFAPGNSSLAISTFFKIDSLNDYPTHDNHQIVLLYGATDNTGASEGTFTLGIVREGEVTKVRFLLDDLTGKRTWTDVLAETPLGSWNHVCAVADRTAGSIVVYMNGVNLNATVLSGYHSLAQLGAFKSTQVIQIGNMLYGPAARHWGAGSFKNGASIDDFKLYSRAISASEVSFLSMRYEPPSAFISQASVEVVEGQSAVFQGDASGVPGPNYRWQMATNAAGPWSDLQDGEVFSGASTSVLSITSTTTFMDGQLLRLRVSNTQGTNVSNSAVLTVIPRPQPPIFSQQPADVRKGADQSAQWTALASGVPTPTLAWQRSTNGGLNWSPLSNGAGFSGVATATLGVASVTQEMHGHLFRLRAENSAGTNHSSAASLFVLVPPSVVTQPASVPLKRGHPAVLTAETAGQPTPVLVWQRSVDGGLNWQPLNGVPGFAGATSGTLQIAEVTSAMEGHLFRLLAENEAGSVSSSAVPLELDNTHSRQVLAMWGSNDKGQTNVPAGLTGVVQAALGANHTLALLHDGTMRAWGLDQQRQCQIPVGLKRVAQVAAGAGHSIALKSDGTLVAWGHTQYGTITIPPAATNVVQIAAAGWHNVALKGDGTVASWGYGLYGQTNVPAGLAGVVKVAAGGLHSLALLGDGRVVGWGRKDEGQLPPATLPQKVKGIAGGWMHTLLLMEDGTVRAFGSNSAGQTNVPANLTDVTAVAAGTDYSMALTLGGRVVVWGGKPEIQESRNPKTVGNPVAIIAGGGHAAVLGVTNLAPSIQLLATPASAPLGHPVVLQAVASDPDGSVGPVELFNQGGAKVGELSKPHQVLILDNLSVGTHRFKARATDDVGLAVTTAEVPVTVVAATNAVSATHTSAGFMLDGTALIDVTIYHTGVASALGYEAELEDGWEYIQDNLGGTTGKPVRRQQGKLEWIWASVPPSPIRFRMEARAPFGTFGNPVVRGSAHAFFQGKAMSAATLPNPLTLEELFIRHHSADYSRSWSFELDELLRVISLFNYSENSRRTGEYHWRLGTDDGYAAGMGDQSRRPHAADTDENWRFGILELLRVVSLYNYYEGNTRSGIYHLSPSGIDGYASGTGLGPLAAGAGMIVRSAAVEEATIATTSKVFSAGQAFEFTLKAAYGGEPSAFGWEVTLPEGWSYSGDDSAANVKPSAGQRGTLGWAWFTGFPPSNTEFKVRVLPPAASSAGAILAARAMLREPLRILESTSVSLSPSTGEIIPPSLASTKPGEIIVTGMAGRRYLIQSTLDLGQPEWTDVGVVTLNGQGVGTLRDDSIAADHTRFYRAFLAP